MEETKRDGATAPATDEPQAAPGAKGWEHVRSGVRLTGNERLLILAFRLAPVIRALVTAALSRTRPVVERADIDGLAEAFRTVVNGQ